MQETRVGKIRWSRDRLPTPVFLGFPCGDLGSIPGLGRSPGEGDRLPTPVFLGFPCGDLGSIPGLGRSPGEGIGYPLQYSGLENPMNCVVHGAAKRRRRVSDFHSGHIFESQLLILSLIQQPPTLFGTFLLEKVNFTTTVVGMGVGWGGVILAVIRVMGSSTWNFSRWPAARFLLSPGRPRPAVPSCLSLGSVTPVSVAAEAAKSLQSCPTLCDPIDGSPPGSPVPGILQARTLEWVAISFCNAWKWKVKVKSLSRAGLFMTLWTAAYQVPPSMGFSRQEYWSGVPLPSPSL